jgi:hypothetical protein
VSFESTSEGLRTTRLAPWLPRRLLHHGRGYVRSYGRVWRRRAAAVWAGGRQAAAAAAEVTAEVARPGLHALRRMRDWLVTRRHRATTEVCAICSPSPPHRCVCDPNSRHPSPRIDVCRQIPDRWLSRCGCSLAAAPRSSRWSTSRGRGEGERERRGLLHLLAAALPSR